MRYRLMTWVKAELHSGIPRRKAPLEPIRSERICLLFESERVIKCTNEKQEKTFLSRSLGGEGSVRSMDVNSA